MQMLGVDVPGNLETRNILRRTGWGRIAPSPLGEVGRVERRILDGHDDLAASRVLAVAPRWLESIGIRSGKSVHLGEPVKLVNGFLEKPHVLSPRGAAAPAAHRHLMKF